MSTDETEIVNQFRKSRRDPNGSEPPKQEAKAPHNQENAQSARHQRQNAEGDAHRAPSGPKHISWYLNRVIDQLEERAEKSTTLSD